MEEEKKMPLFFPPHLLQEKKIPNEIIHKNNIQNLGKNNKYITSNVKRIPMFRMRL